MVQHNQIIINNQNQKTMTNNQSNNQSNNQINQTMSNNQNQNTMNNNTTTPQQEWFLSVNDAKQIAMSSPSSIWKTDDVILLLNRIVKVSEVFVEIPVEKDMSESIELNELHKQITDYIDDIETSMECLYSSIDNIEADTNSIELSLNGNEIYVDDVNIDGKAEAKSDLDSLNSDVKSLTKVVMQLMNELNIGKEDKQ